VEGDWVELSWLYFEICGGQMSEVGVCLERESELRARVCKAHGREYVHMQMQMSERRTQYTIAQTFSRLNAD
jgi:hypothetical protein